MTKKLTYFLLITLTFCFFSYPFSSSYSQEWKDIYHFNPAQTLNKLKFLDAKTGFTAGSLYNGSTENIHITHDGGKTWTNASSGYTAMRFMDIFIQDQSTIFMSGNDGIIIRSIDGGKSWQTMNSGTTQQLWGIHFLDKDLGFAVGSYGTIIKTTNGGSDWEPVSTGISNLFYDVFFNDKGIGFASGSNVLWKTDDYGEHWAPVTYFPFEAPADWIRSIKMISDLIGYACADIGRIYKTTDGGDHWERLVSGTQEALFDVDFVDELNGMICGFNGTILKTNDGGQSWNQMTNPIGNEIFYTVDMITKDLGYICTHTGHILKLDIASATDNENSYTNVNYVYPNPCVSSVYLKLGSITRDEVEQMELCNLMGQCHLVHGIWKNDHELNLDLQGEQSGMQFVKISSSTKAICLPLNISSNSN
jgi:photosystem II stability/assembly factor-like uncharacterized protein